MKIKIWYVRSLLQFHAAEPKKCNWKLAKCYKLLKDFSGFSSRHGWKSSKEKCRKSILLYSVGLTTRPSQKTTLQEWTWLNWLHLPECSGLAVVNSVNGAGKKIGFQKELSVGRVSFKLPEISNLLNDHTANFYLIGRRPYSGANWQHFYENEHVPGTK